MEDAVKVDERMKDSLKIIVRLSVEVFIQLLQAIRYFQSFGPARHCNMLSVSIDEALNKSDTDYPLNLCSMCGI